MGKKIYRMLPGAPLRGEHLPVLSWLGTLAGSRRDRFADLLFCRQLLYRSGDDILEMIMKLREMKASKEFGKQMDEEFGCWRMEIRR